MGSSGSDEAEGPSQVAISTMMARGLHAVAFHRVLMDHSKSLTKDLTYM